MSDHHTNPQHPYWHNTFDKFTWWTNSQGRTFVIVDRWFDDLNQLETITLLEKGKEQPVTRPYYEIFALFKQLTLQRISKSE